METNGHSQGPAPKRATNSITLSWGLVSVALSLYSASESAAGVKRRMFTPDGHEVGKMDYDKATGEKATEIVKMATASDGTLVALDDEEIAAHGSGAVKGVAAVECFIPLSAIGSTYVASAQMFARPNAKVAGADKAFALLCAAMAEREVAALVQVALRGPARYAALLPDGRFVTLAFATEVREAPAMPAAALTDAELAMALTLVDAVGTETPVLADEATARLAAYVEAKAAGAPAPEVAAPAAEPVADLMAALEASVAAAKPAKARKVKTKASA